MGLDFPVKPGDAVYYLVGKDEPRIEKGIVMGTKMKDGLLRIDANFGYFRFGILACLLGTRLFLTEEEACTALKAWTKAC